jgi:hypothetical protein
MSLLLRAGFSLMMFALGTSVARGAPPESNRLTPEEVAAGWKLLFDGKSTAGWEDPARKTPPGDAWTIEDGCLKARAHPRIVEDLVTTETFRDFELVLEWRVALGANSGVKYRIQDRVFLADKSFPRFEELVDFSLRQRERVRRAKGQEYVIAFEYQVIDDGRNRDAGRGGKYQAGAIYDLVAPSKNAARPAGEFNSARIVLRGDQVEHWLNGVKVVQTNLKEAAQGAVGRWGAGSEVFRMLTDQTRKDTPISLQNHEDDAWFRGIKIRRFD